MSNRLLYPFSHCERHKFTGRLTRDDTPFVKSYCLNMYLLTCMFTGEGYYGDDEAADPPPLCKVKGQTSLPTTPATFYSNGVQNILQFSITLFSYMLKCGYLKWF